MITHCETCGASLKKFWHRITPGLVDTLVKSYTVVSSKGENVFNRDELALSNSAYTNLYKLRYHGLLAKHKVNGEWHKGEWLITRRGGQFLRGELAIPFRVQTFRNKVIAHDSDLVKIGQVIGQTPYFETNFEFDYAEEEDLERVPVVAANNKRKRQKTCPICKDKLVSEIQAGEPVDGRIPVRKFLTCANKAGCTYRIEVDL